MADELPDFIVAVERDDYAELYDHLSAIGGPDQAATVRDYQDQVAICAFCGETANLEPYLQGHVEIPHLQGCRQPKITALLTKLPKPLR